MNTSQPQPNSLSDSDLELLSAYIDDQLDASARAEVERRLGAEPQLRAELDELQATTALLRDLAPLAPPRSFTLDPASAPRRRPFLALAWFTQLGGGLAGLALVLLASVQIVLGSAGGAAMAPAPAMAPAAARQAEATEVQTFEAPAAAAPLAAEATPAPAATMGPNAAIEMAPAATEAPMADAPADSSAGAQGPAAARSPAAAESMASDTGAENSALAAPAPTREPTVALSASGISSPDTASPELPAPPTAKQPGASFFSSPAAPLGLGIALLALALGAFLYRRR